MHWMNGVVFCLLLGLVGCHGFYLPGVAPKDYAKGENMTVRVNKLMSSKTQLPYDYYSMPFCKPESVRRYSENLGQKLRGDRIETSLYKFEMMQNDTCRLLCKSEPLTEKQVELFKSRIRDDYRATMILDNLPVAMLHRIPKENGVPMETYLRGYAIGQRSINADAKEVFTLFNHLHFKVKYNPSPEGDKGRVVGFEVKPMSIEHVVDEDWETVKNTQHFKKTCQDGENLIGLESLNQQEVVKDKEIIYTYGIVFEPSSIPWSSRWDAYLMMVDDQVHWFSIVNSVMIVLFLSGMVAMIMLRTLHRDIAAYNEMQTAEEAIEESGWKLVCGDVFRPPLKALLLSSYVGVGSQILAMSLVTMTFAVLGFLSPANRGSLMTAMLLLFVFMGYVAGYYSAKIYKCFKGTEWKRNTITTAFLFPGIVFAIFFTLNICLSRVHSSGAVPFGTLFSLCFLWFGISVPLVFMGSYNGFKAAAIEFPVRTNKIPRQVPTQPWYMRPFLSCLIGGILPFGAVFIELFFILSSMWLNQFYYLFGFLFLVFCILTVTCAEISIVLCYFQLCSEDYHWWWRAYFTSGSSALYLMLYSAYYYSKLDIHGFVSTMLYFGYMIIISYGFFCLTGTIGFFACFWFVRKIYAAVKFD